MPEGLARARTLRSGVSQWEMNSFRPRRAHATRTRSGAPSSERTCSRGPGAGPSSLTSFRSTRVSSGAAYRSSSQLSPSDSPQRRDVTRPPATCQRPSQPPHPATPPPSAPPAIASGHLSMPPRSSLRRRAPSCPFVPSAPRAAHQESVRTANNHRRLPPAGERAIEPLALSPHSSSAARAHRTPAAAPTSTAAAVHVPSAGTRLHPILARCPLLTCWHAPATPLASPIGHRPTLIKPSRPSRTRIQ